MPIPSSAAFDEELAQQGQEDHQDHHDDREQDCNSKGGHRPDNCHHIPAAGHAEEYQHAQAGQDRQEDQHRQIDHQVDHPQAEGAPVPAHLPALFENQLCSALFVLVHHAHGRQSSET